MGDTLLPPWRSQEYPWPLPRLRLADLCGGMGSLVRDHEPPLFGRELRGGTIIMRVANLFRQIALLHVLYIYLFSPVNTS